MTTLTKLQSALGGIYTLESAIMPSWLVKTAFTGQIALGYDYITTDLDKKVFSTVALKLEKFIIGDNWGTFFLNKGIESYLGISKFIAQETNKCVYEVASKSLAIIHAIDNKLEISASTINIVSKFGAYTYESFSNTISAGYEFGTDFYEDFNSTAEESVSTLELDLMDNQLHIDHGAIILGIS
ncbi:MAG: hypothetical protein AB8B46_04445 [Candidatus Midichloriaceae bacterium]